MLSLLNYAEVVLKLFFYGVFFLISYILSYSIVTDTSFEPSVALASLVQHIPLQMITVLIRSLTTDPNVKDASMTQALCR